MAKKWIINNGNLVLGDVQFHRDLVKDHKQTRGGGLWYYEKETNTLFLYGESYDFGKATPQDVKNSLKTCMIRYGNSSDSIVYANEVNIAFSNSREIDEFVIDNDCLLIQEV